MNAFLSVFGLVLKRFFRLKKSTAILLLIVFTVAITMSAINGHQKSLAKSREFQKIDAAKVSQMTNYVHYSSYGAHYLLVPSQLGHLFESSGMASNLTGRVDAYTTLDISISGKSGAIFEVSSPTPFALTFIFVILINLFAIFTGGQIARETEFLKSLGCRVGNGKLFVYQYLSYIILFTLILLCLFAVVPLVLGIAGVKLPGSDMSALTGYFKSAWLMITAVYTMGVLTGSVVKKKYTLTVLLTVWLIGIVFIPNGLNSYIAKKAEDITSRYKIEYEQLDIANNFEKMAVEKFGKFNRNDMETGRKVIELYFKEFYPKIEELENRMKADIAALAELKQELSAWFPTTFFLSTSNSVSGNGPDNLVKFYSFLQEKKKEFLRFWIDRVYYNDPSVLVSFTTEENSNLFHARTTLPGNSRKGSYINLGTIVLLFLVSFYLNNRSIFSLHKNEIARFGFVYIEVDDRDLRIWFTRGTGFKNLLFNLLSGKFKPLVKKGFTGEILVNGTDIATRKCKDHFLYICKPGSVPGDVTVKNLISYHAKIAELSKEEKNAILSAEEITPIAGKSFEKLTDIEKFQALAALTRVKKKQVYLIDDIATGIPLEFSVKLYRKMEALTNEGSIVFYLSTQVLPGNPPLKMENGVAEGKHWIYMVKKEEKLIELNSSEEEEK